MSILNHEIEINAPSDKVWAVLADLEAVQQYNPSVKHARYISDIREGVGAARECDLGKDGMIKERVTDWKPKKSLSMELYESPWPLKFMRWETRLKSAGDGTLLEQKLEYKLKFGLLGLLLDRLMMKGKMDKTLADVFKALKAHAESK